ncbi:regulatory protein RecX [Mongoliitalea daihaiensis]|uniref:regulatory protein RecX n=1 Tax=Mongoliitalea daihaiensis TaxID=2782006 RepID=UPI001F37A6F8|nr:regulatory protein RecX [Mongoliitalea daihaiensis]UJP65676.1 RecX family transcriptional regulator [Mongoliitalea daihaiensis]
MSYSRKDYGSVPRKKYWTPAEAKVKIAAFCAYQERCQQDVRMRLTERGIHGEEAEELIAVMIEEGFLNEERYAQAFARGKFSLKKWGRIKIRQALKFKKISDRCIQTGMREIDPEEYYHVLKGESEKKWNSLEKFDSFQRKMKVQQYLLGRGFEQDLIQGVLSEIEKLK